jgi:NifU-like protein involved in Fe-S cluster formation
MAAPNLTLISVVTKNAKMTFLIIGKHVKKAMKISMLRMAKNLNNIAQCVPYQPLFAKQR